MTLAGGFVFSEEGKKFTAKVDIDANLLLYRDKTYSGAADRQRANSVGVMENLPFGGFNWVDDTAVSFSFDGLYYGGNLSLDDKDGVGGIKIWVKPWSFLKITAGNDIGAGYADSVDADPGMRVYTGAASSTSSWDESKNPDNITQDKGALLESFIGPFTLAFAGQYYDGAVLSLEVNPNINEHSKWVNVQQKKYGYGARVGSAIGAWGKINVSYVNQYSNIAGNNYRLNSDMEAVPNIADAEKTIHMFGLYASLTPPVEGLAVSLGYAGVFTQYVDEFYRGLTPVKTLVPSVYQQGLNLNARYKRIDKLTLRTDHNYSFWTDRDYSTFGIPGRGNYGLDSTVEGAALVNVNHWLLWNGFGAAYQFTPVFKLNFYVRNLYRSDTAAQESGTTWKVSRDKASAELTATFKPFGDSVELYAGFTVEHTAQFSSKEVNAQITDKFVSWVSPFETTDTELVYKIPIGMVIKLE
jgi:hypothetical protein